jgi:Sulfotransferase family
VSVRPVFVLSLPRSGSTLLQRMLATHPEVATTSEPWLLLPQLYALRERGAVAEYGHRTAARAIADFAAALPGGRDDYLTEVRRSALALYERAAGDAAWFLDKTPRYHLVVDEIMALFPDARFVFLWRNPLAVAASMIDSFGRGHWNLDRYEVDLHGGIERLVAAHARRDPRAVALRFEDVVADPGAATRVVFELLGLDPAEAAAEAFAGTSLNGRMGDRTGTAAYSEISGEPVERWRTTMANPLRKRWCAAYLRSLGPERLAAMGYDHEELARAVSGIRPRPGGVASDAARRVYGFGRARTSGRLLARGTGHAAAGGAAAPAESGART